MPKSIKIEYQGEVHRVNRQSLLEKKDGGALELDAFRSLVANIFPALRGTRFVMRYRDDEGDFITVTHPEELGEAFAVADAAEEGGQKKLLRFEVTEATGPLSGGGVKNSLCAPSSGVVHGGVACDECGMNPIVGMRYKCAVRPDYDLCENCEASDQSPYPYIRIKTPAQAPAAIMTLLPEHMPGEDRIPPAFAEQVQATLAAQAADVAAAAAVRAAAEAVEAAEAAGVAVAAATPTPTPTPIPTPTPAAAVRRTRAVEESEMYSSSEEEDDPPAPVSSPVVAPTIFPASSTASAAAVPSGALDNARGTEEMQNANLPIVTGQIDRECCLVDQGAILVPGMDCLLALDEGKQGCKYYVIQVLDHEGQFFVWNRWVGHAGAGQKFLAGPFSKDIACNDFETKFRNKTHNHWQASGFVPVPGKYTIVSKWRPGQLPVDEVTSPAASPLPSPPLSPESASGAAPQPHVAADQGAEELEEKSEGPKEADAGADAEGKDVSFSNYSAEDLGGVLVALGVEGDIVQMLTHQERIRMIQDLSASSQEPAPANTAGPTPLLETCLAAPVSRSGEAVTSLQVPEHSKETILPAQIPGGAESIRRAWYGPRKQAPFQGEGKDVTAQVKSLVARGQELRARNKDFGDPAKGKRKVLTVEVLGAAEAPAEPSAEPVEPLRACFVSDVTIPDKSQVPVGAPFVKTWRVRNDGDVPFPPGCRLQPCGGDLLGGPEAGVPVDPKLPLEEFQVSVELQASNVGNFMGFWRLATPEGQRFGHRLWVDVEVVDNLVDVPEAPEMEGSEGSDAHSDAWSLVSNEEPEAPEASQALDLPEPPAAAEEFPSEPSEPSKPTAHDLPAPPTDSPRRPYSAANPFVDEVSAAENATPASAPAPAPAPAPFIAAMDFDRWAAAVESFSAMGFDPVVIVPVLEKTATPENWNSEQKYQEIVSALLESPADA